jgi:hypothetical protein
MAEHRNFIPYLHTNTSIVTVDEFLRLYYGLSYSDFSNKEQNNNNNTINGNTSQITNNPGNMKWFSATHSYATIYGGVDSGIIATDGGTFVKFPSVALGFEAMKAQLKSKTYKDLTLDEAMKKWSNNGYGAEVSPLLPPNMKMKFLVPKFNELVVDMAKREGFYNKKTSSKSTITSNNQGNNSINKTQFLSFKGVDYNEDNSIKEEWNTNLDFIWSNYSKEEQELYKDLYASGNLNVLHVNTPLCLPVVKSTSPLKKLKSRSIKQITTSNTLNDPKLDYTPLNPYFSQKQLELEKDPSYIRSKQITKQNSNIDLNVIEENCQVWIYSKALDKIINVSPFIQDLTTMKSEVGAFSMTLSPVSIASDSETGLRDYDIIKSLKNSFVNHYNLIKNSKLVLSFFEQNFQQNDVVFIRFEKLKNEKEVEYELDFSINEHNLKDQIFDMIGLIDIVGSNISLENTDYSVSVSGRDLTKVVLEDGSYLMPLIYVEGNSNRFFYGGNFGDKFFKRNYVGEGGFEYAFTRREKSIDDYLKFVVNQLSNVGWCPTDLFNGYTDKRRHAYPLSGMGDDNKYIQEQEVNGVWQIIDIRTDPQVFDRRLINETMMDESGTLFSQFKKACQDPFVHIWGDTYGSKFEFIARQQPFDKEGMKKIVEGKYYIEIENKDVYSINLGWEDEYYSWFKLSPCSKQYDSDESFYDYHFPVIYLEPYVQNFGNHSLYIPDQYVPNSAFVGGDNDEDTNITARALFNDLKYLIETMSVLPFTRKGTIVISGDRRIKVGSFIKLNCTNEICYVESVNNSLSFDKNSLNRLTTLSVKRCMIEKYITDNLPVGSGRTYSSIGLKELYYNYYDIVKSEIITRELLDRFSSSAVNSNSVTDVNSKVTADTTCNAEVFDFFLKRKQFNFIETYKNYNE